LSLVKINCDCTQSATPAIAEGYNATQNSSMDMESVVVSFTYHIMVLYRHWHQLPRQSTRYTPHHVNTLTFPWTGTPLMERNKLWCLLLQIYS